MSVKKMIVAIVALVMIAGITITSVCMPDSEY